ncbi:MAG: anaerobic ribonucleoside-triphosphate reductase, partial [Thermoprotei archaeon]
NFMRNPKLWFECDRREINEAVSIMKKMVKMVREKAMEYEEIDNYLYNVEEIPGESTSYRLAKLDLKYFKEEVEKGEILIPSDGTAPFYSNSIIPYYANVSIPDRARWEGEVQQEFTGGVMMHLFLQESPDPKALKNLVRSIALNTKVVYFSITPTIAVCRKCGWRAIGLFEKCPNCGHEVDLWSRIVGYYRPLRSWNIGKIAEFKLRVQYRVSGS